MSETVDVSGGQMFRWSNSDNTHLGYGPVRIVAADIVSGGVCLWVRKQSLRKAMSEMPHLCWHQWGVSID